MDSSSITDPSYAGLSKKRKLESTSSLTDDEEEEITLDSKWSDPDGSISLISSDNVRFEIPMYHLQSAR